jgi:hypothetical protein
MRADNACRKTLKDLIAQIKQRTRDREAVKNHDLEHGGASESDFLKPTVFYAPGDPTVPGQHGNSYRFNRNGSRWYSKDGYLQRNPAGDPTQLQLIFGTRGSKYLGVNFVSDHEVLLPGADRINWAIDSINSLRSRRNIRKIGLRFYESSFTRIALFSSFRSPNREWLSDLEANRNLELV